METVPLSYLVKGLEGMLNMQGMKIWVPLKWVDVQSSETLSLLFSLN